MFDFFLKKFLKYRKAFGLSYFFFGLPITYFLRDGIALAPGNSLFTAALTLGPLLMVLPLNLFKTYYQPNRLIYTFNFIFLAYALFYLITYAPNRGWFTNTTYELTNFGIIITIFILLATTSINELKEAFLPITLGIATIGCLALIYYTLRNPAFVLGTRVGIRLGAGDDTTSNPHIFAKSAYMGIIASIFLYNDLHKSWQKWFVLACAGICVVVMLLAQSMSSLLGLAMSLGCFAFFNLSFESFLVKTYKILWNWRSFIVLLGLIYVGFSVWQKYHTEMSFILDIIWGRVGRVFNTVTGGSHEDYHTSDLSANVRVETIGKVIDNVRENIKDGNWFELFFGYGYQKLYVDSPYFQSINDFGIVGCILFLVFQFFLIKSVFNEMRHPQNNITQFAAYAFWIFFSYSVTGGMLIDLPRWCGYALAARFLIPTTQFYGRKLSQFGQLN